MFFSDTIICDTEPNEDERPDELDRIDDMPENTDREWEPMESEGPAGLPEMEPGAETVPEFP